MKRIARAAMALILATAVPAGALAQRPAGGGGSRPAPQSHPAPQSRPAPQARPAPQYHAAPAPQYHPAPQAARPAPQSPGFSFPRDVNARPAPQARPPVARPGNVAPGPRAPITRPPARSYVRPIPPNYNGPRIANPHGWNQWGWNHGTGWYPAPNYWGGGFWGPFGIGQILGIALLGSIVDDQDQQMYPSYAAQPQSPGAILLQDYDLTQTPCGPPNLVVIWGPDNSVVCAFPNDLVAPGNYDVDPTTLTLVTPPSQ